MIGFIETMHTQRSELHVITALSLIYTPYNIKLFPYSVGGYMFLGNSVEFQRATLRYISEDNAFHIQSGLNKSIRNLVCRYYYLLTYLWS
jgi:hypothetical protein